MRLYSAGNIEAENRYNTGELEGEPIYESIPASYDRTSHFRANVLEYDFFQNEMYSDVGYDVTAIPSNQSTAVPDGCDNSQIYDEIL